MVKPRLRGGLLLLSAERLDFLQPGFILFPLPAEACLLKIEIAQVLFVGEEDFGLDQVDADRFVLIGEHIGEFQPAQSVDTHFETGDALEAPFGIGQRLD